MAEKIKAPRETLGACECPLCASRRAAVRAAVNGAHRSYMVCQSCNCQLFTRSAKSDEALRARVIGGEPAPAPSNVPAPAADPAPAPINGGGDWDIY